MKERLQTKKPVRSTVALCLAATALPGCGLSSNETPNPSGACNSTISQRQFELAANNIAMAAKDYKTADGGGFNDNDFTVSKSYKKIDRDVGSVTKITNKVMVTLNADNKVNDITTVWESDLLHSDHDDVETISLYKNKEGQWKTRLWGFDERCQDELFGDIQEVTEATLPNADPLYLQGSLTTNKPD